MNWLNEDTATIIQLISFCLEFIGLPLVILETFFKEKADQLEQWIDKTTLIILADLKLIPTFLKQSFINTLNLKNIKSSYKVASIHSKRLAIIILVLLVLIFGSYLPKEHFAGLLLWWFIAFMVIVIRNDYFKKEQIGLIKSFLRSIKFISIFFLAIIILNLITDNPDGLFKIIKTNGSYVLICFLLFFALNFLLEILSAMLVLVIFTFIYPISYLVRVLDKITKGSAIGGLGVFLAVIGFTGEIYQVAVIIKGWIGE